ncbi:hypothetical protein IMSHALPRED_003283 [Imshaugia aleurites]|uniref:Heme haloperoxidase family profile domain-containing protein n=1 Tax=Imshaugia aleurites TaxID=172621 RepID=A0A8H3F9M3_9LECA|nr:hypothetical protein IMSHALPRED_003283 [Imshaugia aleurites]
MKTAYLTVGAGFVARAFAACPFELLKRSGALTEADLAKFEAVKRDPKAAEVLFQAHKREAAPDPSPAGVIGPIVSGVLDLPYGGGLLNGVLQELTGELQAVDVPTPQIITLEQIPGDDPAHQFQAPGPTDVRGICPTLNALANHGYISRDGITSFAEAANAVQIGYGFDYSLSVFLSALGLLAGGDLVSGLYTIGGADARVPNTIGPAGGLDKHGVFEIDGSITRQDVYFGNNANFLLQRWQEYVNETSQTGGLFNQALNAIDNGYRYDISRETNPDFLAGVAWFLVSHAERVFVYEGLANGTTGIPDYNSVAPFFLNETFPENWYRRGVPFTLAGAMTQAIELFLLNPREIGGNEGLGNFVPLGFFNVTNQTPAELGCFILENLLDVAPDQLAPELYDNFELATGFIKGTKARSFSIFSITTKKKI